MFQFSKANLWCFRCENICCFSLPSPELSLGHFLSPIERILASISLFLLFQTVRPTTTLTFFIICSLLITLREGIYCPSRNISAFFASYILIIIFPSPIFLIGKDICPDVLATFALFVLICNGTIRKSG